MNNSDKKCDLCNLMHKVFGDRFNDCSDLPMHIMKNAVALMMQDCTALIAESKSKLEAGDITKEEYDELDRHIELAFSYAAANIPAVALEVGATCGPAIMLNTVGYMIEAYVQRRILDKSESTDMIEVDCLNKDVN